MSDQRLKIAVFIDFDNIEIGVKTTLGRQFDIGAVLEAVKERGEIITKVAYGDWKRAGDYGRAMSNHAVRLVQRVMTPGGDKNGADINLALDALEMAFTHDHINAFVIVGGDSDFITLVEKLKQYDKKVFVVGGRAFTSQVMQKNCTEFLAYENVANASAASGGPSAAPAGQPRGARGDRGRGLPAAQLDAALPLVKRALKVLADREVSPQLGLLKSTLLQLDSSFSERDYGASTFRDFAEKLEKQNFVTLKHSGRTTIVELVEDEQDRSDAVEPAASVPRPAPAMSVRPDLPNDGDDETVSPPTNGNLAEGVALLRSILAETTAQPRWPMYVRQLKQFIRNARPDFDERRYGSILDLMRACQKDGFLRLERDRQGGLRVFASGPVKATSLPHGWSTLSGDEPAPALAPADAADAAEATDDAPPSPPVELDEDSRGNVAPPHEARPKRTRKTTAAAPPASAKPRARKTAARAAEAKPKGRTPARRTRAQASTAHDEGQADRDGRDGENR
jgi:uncharacterized LabA/DUF88 family protein